MTTLTALGPSSSDLSFKEIKFNNRLITITSAVAIAIFIGMQFICPISSFRYFTITVGITLVSSATVIGLHYLIGKVIGYLVGDSPDDATKKQELMIRQSIQKQVLEEVGANQYNVSDMRFLPLYQDLSDTTKAELVALNSPEKYRCHISGNTMHDPVTIDGISYERGVLHEEYERTSRTDLLKKLRGIATNTDLLAEIRLYRYQKKAELQPSIEIRNFSFYKLK